MQGAEGRVSRNQQPIAGYRQQGYIPFGTEIMISTCGVLDSDCTEVTIQRVANFRVKHLNSDIAQIRRGIILLLLPFMQPL